MFMTPQTGMSTPGRKTIHEVRQQVSTTFKLLGSKAADHDASNWESEARRTRFGLQECDKELAAALRARYVYTRATGAPPVIKENEDLRAGLRIILEDESKGEMEKRTNLVIDHVSQACQMEYLRRLNDEIAPAHTECINKLIKTLDNVAAAMRQHESRSTGIKVGSQPVEEEIMTAMREQFVEDNINIFDNHQSVMDMERTLTGMRAARSKQRAGRSARDWQKGADLDLSELKKLTRKEDIETALDERIAEMKTAMESEMKSRSQTALDMLGGGTADMKHNKHDVSSIRKLKDAKLDSMDVHPNARTAALIRSQCNLLAKQNVNTLWAIAPAIKVLTSSNLIGKDVYIIKNNDLVPQEGESENKYLKRMGELGFGPTNQSEIWEDWGEEDSDGEAQDEKDLKPKAVEPAIRPTTPESSAAHSDTESDEAEAPRKILTGAEISTITQENIDAWLTANQQLYTLLEQELKDAVDAAVEKAGKLYGDSLHDSRVNNAARGDGLSVIESWVFSAERFGDTARENAHDFVRHGAGWLVQSNWRGGIETLRLGVAKATDLNCEVTWAMSIARYMEALYAHRPNVAIQITDEYGKEPPNRSKNVIHDIPVFLGRVLKILEQMAQGERKMKEGKPLKESRALLVSRSHNFACNVTEFDSERWDSLDPPESVANFVGKFSSSGGNGKTGGGKSGGGKSSKQSDSKWKMWKPTGAEYDDAGKRI